MDGDRYNEMETLKAEKPTRNSFQILYGIALVLMGVGVFYRIPQVMPQLAQIQQFSNMLWVIRGCFYLMGIVLIGGGLRKLYHNFSQDRTGMTGNGS